MMNPFSFAGLRLGLLAVLVAAATVHGQTLLTGQLLANPGAETGSISGWSQSVAVGAALHIADDGSYEAGYSAGYTPHGGSYQFVAGANSGASGTLYQNVSFTTLAGTTLALIDQGAVSANLSVWQRSLSQGGITDYVQITLEFYDANNLSLGTATTATMNSFSWQQYTAAYAVPAGSRSVTYSVGSFRGANGGQWIDAFTDDHSLTLSAIPEPGTTAAIVGSVGLLVAGIFRRRGRSASGRSR